MSFFSMKRIKSMVKLFVVLLIVFIVAGCFARKTETVQTAEQTSEAIQGERQINAIRVEQQDQWIEIIIQGNQKLVYTSIKQSFPFGIAVYLPETKIADNLKTSLPEINSISDLIVTYADKNKTTVKVEILLKEDLNYEVAENNNGLKMTLLGSTDINKSNGDEIPGQLITDQETKSTQVMPEENIIIPEKTATMTGIEFNTMEDGKSDIVIETNHPVKYDTTQGSDGNLYLNLYNTMIPAHHKRPLLTQYFKSAVKSLMPIQIPGKKKDSRIKIEIRDQVPYHIVRNQNIISLFFEPSRIEPPVFGKAVKKVTGDTQTQTVAVQAKAPDSPKKNMTAADKNKAIEEELFGKEKIYTGEKIKLDFYETDVKNVFRILRSVGGLNFAIDKDVEGKVTLTLENPVPWDQVLDLVLKMNNLGQRKEGNVIRIATLETLTKEETERQDAIEARKKTLEQRKSLEPLVTEYIPINYSNADTDIKPHIDQILTTDRGKLSVDSRTNMIIITDVQEKVDQAREIIFQLDQVTPQIMIEAKVVEVTKNFSRSLGVGLSLTDRTTGNTSLIPDFDVGLNSPITAPMTSGTFNFFRLFGSSTTQLNAQLRASETKGDVNVVSSPRILTLDNKKAKIKQGLEYAYLERDDSGGSSVKFKSIDLLLEVTPHVTPDKRISMTVYVTKNDVDSVTDGVPSLATNEAETELLVNNNDTIIIGGIVKTTDNQSTSGTPILSGIPIIGRLFRTETDTDNRNELLIFITPSIVQLEQKRNIFTTTD